MKYVQRIHNCEGCEERLQNKLFVTILFIQSSEELCHCKIEKMDKYSCEIPQTSQYHMSCLTNLISYDEMTC